MISLDTLVTRLALTGYTVKLSRGKEIDLQEQTELPIIYVGYHTIDSKNPNQPLAYDKIGRAHV